VHRQTADASNLLAHRPATRSTYGAGWASRCRFSSGNPIDRAETPMLGSVPDAQQSGSILSQFGFIRRGDVELALRRMGATIGIPPIYPTEIASNYRGKSSNRCGYSLTTGFFDKKRRTQTRCVSAACQFLAVVSQLAPEINTEPKSEDAKECAYNRDFDWGHRRHKNFSLSFDCTQRGPKMEIK
jgi:hypothetical protein